MRSGWTDGRAAASTSRWFAGASIRICASATTYAAAAPPVIIGRKPIVRSPTCRLAPPSLVRHHRRATSRL